MAYTAPSAVTTGQAITATLYNTFVKDNILDHESRIVTAGPAGVVSAFVGASAPTGWLLCDGSQVSQATYAALYAVVGSNKFGTDTGGNFYLPDLRGRVAVGKGTNTDVDTIGDNDGSALGDRRVKHKHTVVVSESTTGAQAYGSIVNNTSFTSGSGTAQRYIVNTSQCTGIAGNEGDNSFGTAPNHNHSVSATVGPQTTVPTDGPAFLTLNYIIKF